MTRSRGGLGRGLAALIPTGPLTTTVADVLMPPAPADRAPDVPAVVLPLPNATRQHAGRSTDAETPDVATAVDPGGPRFVDLAVDRIRPNPRNPRTNFDEDSLAELAHSIREFGLLQPVVVRPAGDDYELVMGERRWRAAQRAGIPTIPAIVRRTEDAALLRDALLENIHRANLNPLEEAAAYQQLLAEFDVTHDELATRLGRSRPVISNTIRLLKLPVAVQRRVAAGVLSAGHARALLSLDDADQQEELAARVVAEGLSVRGTEEAVVLLSTATPRRRRTVPRRNAPPGLDGLAGRLSDVFDTRVRVELGRAKGRMILEFATVEDLHRIVAVMAPAALGDGGDADAADQGTDRSAE
ncbi:ParB/RepB/Spo0J family partition protein [Nakamurella endophytica]|uniref:Chromosome partitioning protein ParB n=1 Tax=Nakamurella endophytica TaxID=1748367 RepID=A0A917WF09_9ACTN|nr:ParB/RepB/Spo0J family partition protein [Nakamurella endophytica]GGL97330.1 chromosome partitioning protein ParB [Nakamurella endophytica]